MSSPQLDKNIMLPWPDLIYGSQWVFPCVSVALIFILLDFLERQLFFYIQNAFFKNILFRIFQKIHCLYKYHITFISRRFGQNNQKMSKNLFKSGFTLRPQVGSHRKLFSMLRSFAPSSRMHSEIGRAHV